jgi:hypothetical protein
MATSMFFCSQCGELKGIENESCGREKKIEKVWRKCEISHETIWLGRIPRKYLQRWSYVGFPGFRGLDECGKKATRFSYFKGSLDSSHILLCHNTRFTLFPTAAAGSTEVKVHVSSKFSHVSVVFMTLAWLRKQIPNTSPKRSEWTRNHQNTMHVGMDLNTSRK